MQTRISSVVLVSLAALSCAGGGHSAQPAPGYAPAPSVYTADGRVLGVEHGPSDSPATTVSIVVQPDGAAPVHVELAPGWYLDKRGLRFSEQDRVHVEGRRDDRSGSTVVVARRIKKDGTTVELRNDADEPTWEH